MAIDTVEKRKSISGIWLGLPGVTPNILQDGEWRQQSGWSYSGIVPVVPIDLSAQWIPEPTFAGAWEAQIPAAGAWMGQVPIAPAWTPEPPL